MPVIAAPMIEEGMSIHEQYVNHLMNASYFGRVSNMDFFDRCQT